MFNESTPNSTIAPREHIQGQQDCFYVDYDRDAVDAFYATYIFSIVLNSVSAMPAIFLNALVIMAICRRSSLQTPSNVLLCSLALTDFLVGLIVQPVFIAHKVSALKAERRLHCIASVVSKTLALLLGTVSLTTLTAISIDRVLAISLPSRYRTVVTKGGAVKTAIVLWVFGIVMSVILLLRPIIFLYCIIAVVLTCLLVTTTAYFRVYQLLRRHQAQIGSTAGTSTSFNVAKYRNSVRTVTCLLIVMLLCYSPFLVSSIVLAILPTMPGFKAVFNVTHTILFFNSSLNAILYCWKMKRIRLEVVEILSKFNPYVE